MGLSPDVQSSSCRYGTRDERQQKDHLHFKNCSSIVPILLSSFWLEYLCASLPRRFIRSFYAAFSISAAVYFTLPNCFGSACFGPRSHLFPNFQSRWQSREDKRYSQGVSSAWLDRGSCPPSMQRPVYSFCGGDGIYPPVADPIFPAPEATLSI